MAELQNADQLEKTLRGIDTTDAVRADAWDAYANAKTPDELVGSLKSLKIPPAGKKQLVDMWGPAHGYKVVGKAEAAKAIAKPPEQPKASPGPPKEQEGDPWYNRAAKGLYDSTVGQVTTANEQMAKHPIEAALTGPIGPAIHEGVKSAIESRARSADPKASTADRIEAGLGGLPPGPVGAAGTMAQHVMHKLRSGDYAGLAGEATGTGLMALLLGKVIPSGAEGGESIASTGEPEITATAGPGAKPEFTGPKNAPAAIGRQVEGREARQISGPPEPPGPPDRVFEQGPISHKQIEGPRNPPAPPGARSLPRPGQVAAGPPKQIAARPSGSNPQPTWDMTLAWAKRLPPEQLQGIVSKMREAVSEHGEKLSPEDRATSQERLQKLEELLPKKNGVASDASHKAQIKPNVSAEEGERAGARLISRFKNGDPGVSVEVDSSGNPHERGRSVVYRDSSGKPQGYLHFYLDDDLARVAPRDHGLKPEVWVSPEVRRQGVATKLYDAAHAAGYDLSDISGQETTPAGAAFLNSRNAKATPGPESAKAEKPNPIDKSDRTKQTPAPGSNVGQAGTEAATRAVEEARKWGSRRSVLEVVSDRGRTVEEIAFDPTRIDAAGIATIAKKLSRGTRLRVSAMDQTGRRYEAPI